MAQGQARAWVHRQREGGVQGLRFAVHGSRFAVHGSRFTHGNPVDFSLLST